MALRPVSEIGLMEATDVPREPDQAPAAATPSSSRRPRRRSSPAAGAQRRAPRVVSAPTEARAAQTRLAVGLGDEPTSFLQIIVPGELHERLTDVSYALKAEHPKLHHQKTILGALIWRYVDAEATESLGALGALLDEFLVTDVAEAPAEVKVGAHLPFSLKYRLEGAALALRRTRRAASGKTVLSALIAEKVHRDGLPELVELLIAYHAESRPVPRPLPVAADEPSVRPAG